MKRGLQWIFFGLLSFLLFFYFSLNQSILTTPAQNSLFIALTLILIITGIFEIRKKYYNRTLYLTMITLILVICYIISSESANKGNIIFYYLLSGTLTLIIMGLAYEFTRRMKIYQEIIQKYNKTLKKYPKNTKTWNNKGTALISLKEYQEAIKCFDKALEIDPNDAAAWHNKGVSLEKLGKHQEAIKYYDRALELDPKFENAKKDGKIILEN